MRTHHSRAFRIFAVAILVIAIFGGWSALPVAADTLQVTITANSGEGSLRDRISDAVAGDTITFNLPGSAPWTITLESAITINKHLTIQGPGEANLTISGGDVDNILNIGTGPVTINDLTLRDGLSDFVLVGSAINSSGTLTLNNVTVTDNSGLGGAIRNTQGTLAINNSTISANQDLGIGAFNASTTITGTEVSGNAEGGIAASGTGQLSVIDSAIHHNDGSDGGGIGFSGGSGATLTVTNSTITENTALAGGGISLDGGTLTMTNSTVSDNTATDGAGGGLEISGEATITGGTIDGNRALEGSGGGISFGGTLNLYNSTISGNQALFDGGAISGQGFMDLSGVVIADNHSTGTEMHGISYGAFNLSVPLTGTLANVTFSGNGPLVQDSVVIAENGHIGAVLNVSVSGQFANVTVALTNVTIAGNDGGTGAIAFATANGAVLTATIQNSILADNTPANFAGTGITSGGRNISDDDSGSGILTATGDLNETDPLLDVDGLEDNGGAVETIALQEESPAIDRVPQNGANCPDTDARGFVRPAGEACDSGAFEAGATAPPSPSPSPSPSTSPSPSPSPSPVACDSPFTDVPDSHVACPAITALAEQGIIFGYTAQGCQAAGKVFPCYGPNDDVQRAQVAVFLVRALGWEDRPTGPRSFNDFGGLVQGLRNASLIVANACDEEGQCVAQGYGDGRFGPTDSVSYAQVITFIARAFGLSEDFNWEEQPEQAVPYTGVPAVHLDKVRIYHHYAGAIPDAPTTSAGWNDEAPREWVARVLHQAITSAP